MPRTFARNGRLEVWSMGASARNSFSGNLVAPQVITCCPKAVGICIRRHEEEVGLLQRSPQESQQGLLSQPRVFSARTSLFCLVNCCCPVRNCSFISLRSLLAMPLSAWPIILIYVQLRGPAHEGLSILFAMTAVLTRHLVQTPCMCVCVCAPSTRYASFKSPRTSAASMSKNSHSKPSTTLATNQTKPQPRNLKPNRPRLEGAQRRPEAATAGAPRALIFRVQCCCC